MKLLLDEHLSRAVAAALTRRELDAVALHSWPGGCLLEASDEAIRAEAARETRVLVADDKRTILPLLKLWLEAGRTYSGVVFVDDRTIVPDDVGSLVNALLKLDRQGGNWDWTNRTVFLGRHPRSAGRLAPGGG